MQTAGLRFYRGTSAELKPCRRVHRSYVTPRQKRRRVWSRYCHRCSVSRPTYRSCDLRQGCRLRGRYGYRILHIIGICETEYCTSDAQCDDGSWCNGAESCVAGACQQGTPVVCGDDGLFCTGTEACVETGGGAGECQSSGDPCGGGEICQELDQCVIPACFTDADCDNGNQCTADVCLNDGTAAAVCSSEHLSCGPEDGCCPSAECSEDLDADCAVCDDGRCAVTEDCLSCPEDCAFSSGEGDVSACFKGVADGSCNPVKDGPTCPDCLPSTCCGDAICETPGETVENCPGDCQLAACSADADCDDGLYCNGVETCLNGSCQSGLPPSCGSGKVCDEGLDACVAPPACAGDADCSDGDACTIDACIDGDCSHTDIPSCNPAACFKGAPDGSCHPKELGTGCPDCLQ